MPHYNAHHVRAKINQRVEIYTQDTTKNSIALQSRCRLRTANCHEQVMQLVWLTGLRAQPSHFTAKAV